MIKTLAIICAFASMTAFITWLLRKATAAYLAGTAFISEVSQLNPVIELKESPILARLGTLGSALIPLVKRWQDTDALDINARLREWERLLVKAGIRGRLTAEQFLSASLVSALCGAAIFALVAYLLRFGVTGALLLGVPVGTAVGFVLPGVTLKSLAKQRQLLIEKRLPFAIEFMLLAMEANAAFTAAMEVYCGQMVGDPLADELRVVLSDIDNGLTVQQALNDLGARVESDSLSAFILAVNTGIDTGQPVKAVFQTQSNATRQRRYQSAEEIAKTASTRAVFPLFVVLIAVLILLLGPLLIHLGSAAIL